MVQCMKTKVNQAEINQMYHEQINNNIIMNNVIYYLVLQRIMKHTKNIQYKLQRYKLTSSV